MIWKRRTKIHLYWRKKKCGGREDERKREE